MDSGLGCLVVQETTGCCERSERLVGGGNRLIVGVVGRDPDVGDMHTCLPDGRYGLGEASEEGLCLAERGQNRWLIVHDEQRAALGVDGGDDVRHWCSS